MIVLISTWLKGENLFQDACSMAQENPSTAGPAFWLRTTWTSWVRFVSQMDKFNITKSNMLLI